MLIKMKISIQAPFQLHPQQIIDSIIPLVDMAVVAIMHIYEQVDHGVEIKVDQSPLT